MNARTRFWGVGTRRWRVEDGRPRPRATLRRRSAETTSRVPSPPAARLLFINQYYWPDHASTAQHLTDLAESLVTQGHEVHVLCSRGSYRSGGVTLPRSEVRNGVHIHRVGATSLGRRSTLTRMIDYLSFYAKAAYCALRMPRFDLVATLTTPPLIGLVGTILRRIHGSQHLYWSMDLHPDASLALGRMSPRNPVVRGLAWLSDMVYRNADRVVVLGSYMADRVSDKRVRPTRVVTIPVWSRKDEIYPLPRENHPLRDRLGLQDKFVAMYSGNLGLAHRFDEFLEAARRLRHRPDFVFLYVGGGPRLTEVREAKRRDRLDNVILLDYVPREELHISLSMADVHLISMRPEMTGLVVPSKLYGAMASSRPVLFVGPDHCETADEIRRCGCGRTLRVGDVGGLVKGLEELHEDPEAARLMGQQGREAFLADYERERCCAQWVTTLDDLLGGRGLLDQSAQVSSPPIPRMREGSDSPVRWSIGRRAGVRSDIPGP